MPGKWKALARRAERREPKGKKKSSVKTILLVPIFVVILFVLLFAAIAFSLFNEGDSDIEVAPTATQEPFVLPDIEGTPGVLAEPEEVFENPLGGVTGRVLDLVPFFMVVAIFFPILMRIFGRDK